mmetsp:Transcript_7148/g.21800  ORF Transcript_7148/g.21800 Transcript_7148/m.21800 type:complete len:109 (+) Transcript_7148:2287-2613(+)
MCSHEHLTALSILYLSSTQWTIIRQIHHLQLAGQITLCRALNDVASQSIPGNTCSFVSPGTSSISNSATKFRRAPAQGPSETMRRSRADRWDPELPVFAGSWDASPQF